jgi:hypothetical protein
LRTIAKWLEECRQFFITGLSGNKELSRLKRELSAALSVVDKKSGTISDMAFSVSELGSLYMSPSQ